MYSTFSAVRYSTVSAIRYSTINAVRYSNFIAVRYRSVSAVIYSKKAMYNLSIQTPFPLTKFFCQKLLLPDIAYCVHCIGQAWLTTYSSAGDCSKQAA